MNFNKVTSKITLNYETMVVDRKLQGKTITLQTPNLLTSFPVLRSKKKKWEKLSAATQQGCRWFNLVSEVYEWEAGENILRLTIQ